MKDHNCIHSCISKAKSSVIKENIIKFYEYTLSQIAQYKD